MEAAGSNERNGGTREKWKIVMSNSVEDVMMNLFRERRVERCTANQSPTEGIQLNRSLQLEMISLRGKKRGRC